MNIYIYKEVSWSIFRSMKAPKCNKDLVRVLCVCKVLQVYRASFNVEVPKRHRRRTTCILIKHNFLQFNLRFSFSNLYLVSLPSYIISFIELSNIDLFVIWLAIKFGAVLRLRCSPVVW